MDERPQNPQQFQFPYTAAPQPPQPPRKKRRALRIGGLGCFGLIALLIIGGIASLVGGVKNAPPITALPADTSTATAAGTTATATAATGATDTSTSPAAAASTSAPAAPVAPAKHVALTVKGEGTKTTKTFSTGDDWSIAYTFNCASFGSQGNFQIYTYTDGSLSDTPVNALDEKGSDTTYEHGDSGTHYLEINSECSWTVTVTDGDSGQ
ncbi:hypothetical protein KGA66_19610 [Actinocrinis puniceicyclus]|uniref:Uncharacterized protein n=1 Tax=Actinocrinis puniceicyclus TaxID=977794 RepID=A0A8J7WMU9_9ACTN|nr:hypothetical protein [Actinocrinis puniceicyclus]MBS2965266.1 hypothetical protein [Actinocrinis puniceicyclus]